jgi:hypothetical protein
VKPPGGSSNRPRVFFEGGKLISTYISLLRYTQHGIESVKESPARLEAARKAPSRSSGPESRISTWSPGNTTQSSSVKPLMTRRWPRPRCSWGLAATFGPRRFALSQRRSSARSSPRCHSAHRRALGGSRARRAGNDSAAAELDQIVADHFGPTVLKTGFELKRLDQRQPAGLIDDQLRVRIRACRRSRRRTAKTWFTKPTALCVNMCHERHFERVAG